MLFCLLQASSPPSLNDNSMTLATWVIAVGTLAYLITTLLLWLTTRQSVTLTRRMFEESNRPRIGATEVKRDISYAGSGKKQIKFAVTYINKGAFTAHDVKTSVDLVVNEKLWPDDVREEELIQVILPDFENKRVRLINESEKTQQIEEASTLKVVFNCTYRGPSGQGYKIQQKFRHDKVDGGFELERATST